MWFYVLLTQTKIENNIYTTFGDIKKITIKKSIKRVNLWAGIIGNYLIG